VIICGRKGEVLWHIRSGRRHLACEEEKEGEKGALFQMACPGDVAGHRRRRGGEVITSPSAPERKKKGEDLVHLQLSEEGAAAMLQG